MALLQLISSVLSIASASSFVPSSSRLTTRLPPSLINQRSQHHLIKQFSSAPSDVEDVDISNDPSQSAAISPSNDKLKNELLRLCASYDRGFSASPSAKQEVNDLVNQLKEVNPTPINAANGVDGSSSTSSSSGYDEDVPLKGIWRMVWTTALDVANLAASPIATPGAIYQVIDPPIATNVIDFIPRAQSLFPDIFPSTLFRAEVKTRTYKRRYNNSSNENRNNNRVGLDFEAVKLSPVQILGMDAKNVPPFNVNFPNVNEIFSTLNLPGLVVDPETSPGFFDVVYLDDDMLIIQQNAPGGYFVSIKVPDYDP